MGISHMGPFSLRPLTRTCPMGLLGLSTKMMVRDLQSGKPSLLPRLLEKEVGLGGPHEQGVSLCSGTSYALHRKRCRLQACSNITPPTMPALMCLQRGVTAEEAPG